MFYTAFAKAFKDWNLDTWADNKESLMTGCKQLWADHLKQTQVTFHQGNLDKLRKILPDLIWHNADHHAYKICAFCSEIYHEMLK